MLTLIFVRNKFMVPIGLMLFEYFSSRNSRVIVAEGSGVFDALLDVGLEHFKEVIEIDQLEELLEASAREEVEFVLFHYKGSLEILEKLGAFARSHSRAIRCSFYGDQYVNVFLSVDDIERFFEKDTALTGHKAYSLDYVKPYYRKRIGYLDHEVIGSQYWNRVYDKFDFATPLEPLYNELSNEFLSKEDGVFIVVLRPYGSRCFHSGNYSLSIGSSGLLRLFFRVYSVVCEHFFRKPKVIIKLDNRDAELMEEFVAMLQVELEFGVDVFILDQLMPNAFTFDPFLYYFNRKFGNNYSTFVFDSVSTIPFLNLGIGNMHFIGAPLNLVETMSDGGFNMTALRKKITGIVMGLDRPEINEVYERTEIEDGLHCFKKRLTHL